MNKTLLSIIVGYVNEHDQIYKFLENIKKTIKNENYEIIICSKKEVSKEIKYEKTIQIYTRNGYSKAFNDGIKCSKGKYIVISNADSFVETKDWDGIMIDELNKNNAKLCQTLIHQSTKNEPAVEVFYDLPSFFWMIKKPILLFDERYAENGGAYFDDYDYTREVRQKRQKVIVTKKVNILHTSEGYMQKNSQRDQHRAINKKIYENKWKEEIQEIWLEKLLQGNP